MAGKTILLVDDDPDLSLALKTVLESAGYTVETAANRTEGWEKVQQVKPDLAVVDVMMDTQTDGFDLTYDIRRDEALKATPIIMLTAINATLPFHFDPKSDGDFIPVEKFLEKPVEPEVLLKEVAALL